MNKTTQEIVWRTCGRGTGDYNWTPAYLDWTVTVQDGNPLLDVIDGSAPATGATDVIYAGDGGDYVWGDFGNDVLFGEGVPRWRTRAANDETTNAWGIAA